MSDGPIDSYLRELERVLRARKLEAERIVEEARDTWPMPSRTGFAAGSLAPTPSERRWNGSARTTSSPRMRRPRSIPSRRGYRRARPGPAPLALDLAATAIAALLTSVVQFYALPTRY
jgi:hypothetical protein